MNWKGKKPSSSFFIILVFSFSIYSSKLLLDWRQSQLLTTVAQNITSWWASEKCFLRGAFNKISSLLMSLMFGELFVDSCFTAFFYELAVLDINSGDIYIPLSLCYYVFSNGLIAVFLAVTARLLSLFKREGCTRRQRRNFLSITSVIDFLISTSIHKSRFRTRLSLWGGGVRKKREKNEQTNL